MTILLTDIESLRDLFICIISLCPIPLFCIAQCLLSPVNNLDQKRTHFEEKLYIGRYILTSLTLLLISLATVLPEKVHLMLRIQINHLMISKFSYFKVKVDPIKKSSLLISKSMFIHHEIKM